MLAFLPPSLAPSSLTHASGDHQPNKRPVPTSLSQALVSGKPTLRRRPHMLGTAWLARVCEPPGQSGEQAHFIFPDWKVSSLSRTSGTAGSSPQCHRLRLFFDLEAAPSPVLVSFPQPPLIHWQRWPPAARASNTAKTRVVFAPSGSSKHPVSLFLGSEGLMWGHVPVPEPITVERGDVVLSLACLASLAYPST